MKKLFATMLLFCTACNMKVPTAEPADTSPLAVAASREVTLRYVRFDVTGFAKRLSKADLLALPLDTRRRLWLLDLDIAGTDGSPRLIDNSLRAIREMSPTDPSLGTAERNMVRLLQMTPDTARLEGTSVEELLRIAPRIGLAPAQVLADALGINVEDPFLAPEFTKDAIIDRVIRSHPNAVTRLGPKTATNPSGVYPVARGVLPITLEDTVSDFASLSEKFGPYNEGGVYHPGFIVGQVSSSILTPDFGLIVKANPNALPFKGIDGTNASIASVNSIGNDRRPLFNFADPSWLTIEGLPAERLQIDKLTFQITESPLFHTAGTSPLPAPYGNSTAWQTPSYVFERLVLDGALRMFAGRNYSRSYTFGGNPSPLVTMTIVNGYLTITTAADLGNPPPPLYLHEMLLEAAQVRLHDAPEGGDAGTGADAGAGAGADADAGVGAGADAGAGAGADAGTDGGSGRIPEGGGTIRFNLSNIPIGVTADRIHGAIRANIEADPTSLVNVASQLFDNGSGAADFFYVRAESDSPPDLRGDWLFFVGPDDMRRNAEGQPKRDYARYARVGFFSDSDLTTKVSATTSVAGDATREKVRIDPDDQTRQRVYFQDDDAAVFEVLAVRKPSDRQVTLRITRIR